MALTIDFTAPIDVQIAHARSANVLLADDWYALPAEKRAQAFTVSGLARLDQVQAVADALAEFQAGGGTLRDFKKWAAGQDWTLPRHRLETIYRNAVQTAYQAGHWRSFAETADDLPYLMYDAINDSRVRPAHLAMDGVIRPVGDPLWQRWSPPAGHRCRCTLRQIGRRETRERGGVTASLPAEAEPDPGWGHNPTDGFKGLLNSIESRLNQCRVALGAQFAGRRGAPPLWCADGPFRDHLLMQQAWAERGGAMPEPRELTLPALRYDTPKDAFRQFMRALGTDETSLRVPLVSGDTALVSDDLFRNLQGGWKIAKRERDQWLLYVAELIKSPQEVWRLDLTMTEELYLLGRFKMGKTRIDAVAVFTREKGADLWSGGKTAYTFDKPDGLDRKRREIMTASGACVRWIENKK